MRRYARRKMKSIYGLLIAVFILPIFLGCVSTRREVRYIGSDGPPACGLFVTIKDINQARYLRENLPPDIDLGNRTLSIAPKSGYIEIYTSTVETDGQLAKLVERINDFRIKHPGLYPIVLECYIPMENQLK